MPLVEKFRIDNENPAEDGLEFYVKINDENNRKLLNLCLCGDGLYYYKAGSQILTPKENGGTQNTYDGCLPMPKLKEIFEKLLKAGWRRKAEDGEQIVLVVSQKGNKVILEIESVDD